MIMRYDLQIHSQSILCYYSGQDPTLGYTIESPGLYPLMFRNGRLGIPPLTWGVYSKPYISRVTSKDLSQRYFYNGRLGRFKYVYKRKGQIRGDKSSED